MRWICDCCGDEFSNKKELIRHLEAEYEEKKEMAHSADEDVLTVDCQLAELLSSEKKATRHKEGR